MSDALETNTQQPCLLSPGVSDTVIWRYSWASKGLVHCILFLQQGNLQEWKRNERNEFILGNRTTTRLLFWVYMARGLYRLASYSLGEKLEIIAESFTFFISNLDLLRKSLLQVTLVLNWGMLQRLGRKEGERKEKWQCCGGKKCLPNLESYNMGLNSNAVACWVILAKLCSISEYPFPYLCEV